MMPTQPAGRNPQGSIGWRDSSLNVAERTPRAAKAWDRRQDARIDQRAPSKDAVKSTAHPTGPNPCGRKRERRAMGSRCASTFHNRAKHGTPHGEAQRRRLRHCNSQTNSVARHLTSRQPHATKRLHCNTPHATLHTCPNATAHRPKAKREPCDAQNATPRTQVSTTHSDAYASRPTPAPTTPTPHRSNARQPSRSTGTSTACAMPSTAPSPEHEHATRKPL